MKAILLPGNSLKFPLVKVIVSKIAYKSLKTTKNSHFLRTDHRNVVHENFFRDFGDIICIKNLFRPIRVINRTNSWAIWTRISEDIDHFSKWPANPPRKKNSQVVLASAPPSTNFKSIYSNQFKRYEYIQCIWEMQNFMKNTMVKKFLARAHFRARTCRIFCLLDQILMIFEFSKRNEIWRAPRAQVRARQIFFFMNV